MPDIPDMPLNVIEFIEHTKLLNDRSLSLAQRVILKSIYGLHLNQSELEFYYAATGLDMYAATEVREATIIAGRRSGKTYKIAAPIVIYEAFRDHGVPEGEDAYVLLLAPTIKQAKIAFRAIRKYLRQSPLLAKRIVHETREAIKLDNGVTIACYVASYSAVRGLTIVASVCDEMAFWPHDSNAANPESETLDALYPGMANVMNPKLIKISTPFGKRGTLWTEFQRRASLPFPVFQVTTSEMNPTIKPAELEMYRKRDDSKYRREFMAEFSEDINAWIDAEILYRCVVPGRKQSPPEPGVFYFAAIDPAFRHDDFALAIAHRDSSGTVVLDLLVRWRGSKKIPVCWEQVRDDIKYYCKQYGIYVVHCDQHCAAIIQEQLLQLGIHFKEKTFGPRTRAEIFGNLKHLLRQSKIELLDNHEFLEQLLNLEELTKDAGRIDIQPAGTMRDDLAVVVALCCDEVCKQEGALPEPRLGIVDRSLRFLNYIPSDCPVAAVCANFPNCMDAGSCQGFEDQRLIVISPR
jgi:hypothetical protein